MDADSTKSRDRYHAVTVQQPMAQNDYYILYIWDGAQQQRFYRLIQFKCKMRRIWQNRQNDSDIGKRVICKRKIYNE